MDPNPYESPAGFSDQEWPEEDRLYWSLVGLAIVGGAAVLLAMLIGVLELVTAAISSTSLPN